jgi:hypothetical protein
MLDKCSGCGGLDHIMSSWTASDDAFLKWTLAKRKLIVHKYGFLSGTAPVHVALLGDISHADSHVLASLDVPSLEECTDDYDDTEVSGPFGLVAFSSSLAPGRDVS